MYLPHGSHAGFQDEENDSLPIYDVAGNDVRVGVLFCFVWGAGHAHADLAIACGANAPIDRV